MLCVCMRCARHAHAGSRTAAFLLADPPHPPPLPIDGLPPCVWTGACGWVARRCTPSSHPCFKGGCLLLHRRRRRHRRRHPAPLTVGRRPTVLRHAGTRNSNRTCRAQSASFTATRGCGGGKSTTSHIVTPGHSVGSRTHTHVHTQQQQRNATQRAALLSARPLPVFGRGVR